LIKKNRSGKYIVSFDTFMLQPVIEGNRVSTHVIERSSEFGISRKPQHVVKNSCDYYGGSLQNSTNTAKLVLRKRHKTPIIVAHDLGIPCILIPTMSPSSNLNSWILYSAIEAIIEDDMCSCIVLLENGRSIKLNISETTMRRQFSMATLLERNFFKKQRQLSNPSNFKGFDNSDDD
jgi:competence protein ComK